MTQSGTRSQFLQDEINFENLININIEFEIFKFGLNSLKQVKQGLNDFSCLLNVSKKKKNMTKYHLFTKILFAVSLTDR
jgi:hypothetical protein